MQPRTAKDSSDFEIMEWKNSVLEHCLAELDIFVDRCRLVALNWSNTSAVVNILCSRVPKRKGWVIDMARNLPTIQKVCLKGKHRPAQSYMAGLRPVSKIINHPLLITL